VAWLRGTEHDSFRNRSESGQLRLIGDIIFSDPQYKNDVLYIGANDGMLHAFDAASGEELFAYIPGELLSSEPGRSHAPLSRPMDKSYNHRFFMDGTVTVADVTIDGAPKTYLIGSMGAGGRTVFALDVTNIGDVDDPQEFSAANIKWEFTDPELGYKASTPAVVRMSDGTWAAVFGNGFNSDSGKASLFVVSLEDGSLIKRIDTNDETENGLAGPFITDWPKRDLRAGRIYAGDVKGNLWVFDVSSLDPDAWTNADNRRILFTARDDDGNPQPITSRPFGATLDANSVMITFGTGSYFRVPDKDDVQVQSLYGIVDVAEPGPNPQPVVRSANPLDNELLEQDIIAEVTPESGAGAGLTFRFISQEPFLPNQHKGWFVDLDTETGERVINSPRTLGTIEQRVRFTTLIPDDDPCGIGRRGFLMDIGS
jgi:type IV pilus assembly protein PilY1